MRQIGLIPAGCQLAFNGGVKTTTDYICYASSVALYFLHPKTFSVMKIIAYNSRAICCFSLDSTTAPRVAVGSMDGSLSVWNIDNEELISKVTFEINTRSFVDWLTLSPDTCIVVINSSHPCIYTWVAAESGSDPRPLALHRKLPEAKFATCLKSSPHTKGLFAVGCNDGSVLVESCEDRQMRKTLRPPSGVESGQVIELQWDPKSQLYILAAYDHIIILWDYEAGTCVHTFDKQGTGISAMAWMDWAAGSFVSSNHRTGVLKLWNVSLRQAQESVRVPCGGGILGVAFLSGSSKAACCCSDGSILLYDFVTREVVNSTCAGHTDTVFDCCFSPSDPNVVVTCSFDGTLKMWNITELKLLKSFFESESIFYSCVWSPCGRLLACTSIKGEVILWNIETGRAVVKYEHHSKASYCIRWHPDPSHSSKLCSTSADGSVVVFDIPLDRLADARSGAGILLGSNRKKNNITEVSSVLCRIDCSSPAFGCAWCPTLHNILCVGYADSLIRIYDYELSALNPAPIIVLRGHADRVFSCAWSPIVPGLLASGSDDKTIAIWKLDLKSGGSVQVHPINNGTGILGNVKRSLGLCESPAVSDVAPLRVLRGHRSNVRALGWNHEHEDVLQSGSWDSVIKVWNARKGVCVQNVNGHVLDVYTVVAHPKRPFTYVSTSRDTTIRTWEMEGIFVNIRMRVIMEFSMERYIESDDLKSSTEGMIPGTELTNEATAAPLSLMLRGKYSNVLAQIIRNCRSKILLREGLADIPTNVSFWHICMKNEANKLQVAEVLKDILSFFCGSNGSMQMWSIAKQSLDVTDNSGGPSYSVNINSTAYYRGTTVNSAVISASKVLGIARSEAQQAESLIPVMKRNSDADMDIKYKILLKKAALAYLKSGDFVKYCELLIELGEWLEAIAFAPCISHEFWEGITRLYAEKVLYEKTAAAAIPYYVAVGQDFEAIKSCMDNRDYQDALVLTKMSEERVDLISCAKDRNIISSTQVECRVHALRKLFLDARSLKPTCRQRTETEDEEYRSMACQVLSKILKESWDKSLVFEAAANCFVIGDAATAVEILKLAGELDIAFALSSCFGIAVSKDLIWEMSIRAVFLGDLTLAVNLLSDFSPTENSDYRRPFTDERSLRDRKFVAKVEPVSTIDIEKGLLICRHRNSRNPVERGELLHKYGLPPLHVWHQLGIEMEVVGDDADALGCFAVCGETTEVLRSSYLLPHNL